MNDLSSRQRAIVIGVAVAVAVFAAWFFFVSPKRAEAGRLESEVAAAQDRLAAAQREERTTREKQQRLPALPALKLAMPDDVEMSRILRELNLLGEAAGVEFQSVTPAPVKAEQGFRVVPLNVVFEGTFARISAFLERLRERVQVRDGKLRANGRLFVVESVQLVEGENKLPSLKATMALDAFVYGGGATASAAP